MTRTFLFAIASTLLSTSLAGCDTGESTAADAGVAMLPQTCADILALDAQAADKDYTLYVGGAADKPWTVSCVDMASRPKEYLPLPRSGGGYNSATLRVQDATATASMVTTYAKLRIDPRTFIVDAADARFASTDGAALAIGPAGDSTKVRFVPFGVAASCIHRTQPLTGPLAATANIDLAGTGFAIDTDWCDGGSMQLDQVATRSSDQTAAAIAGGIDEGATGDKCGFAAPSVASCPAEPLGSAPAVSVRLAYVRRN